MQMTLDIVLVILLVDFVSGVLHWLEDSYGNPDWPVIGRWITAPNILHHQSPTAFTTNSWLRSADVLLVLGGLIVGTAWLSGALTWQVILFVAIGVNANAIHKWNHLPRSKRGKVVVALQKVSFLQTPAHHARHHVAFKDTHYCVITNLVNPILDAVRFWRGLEWIIEKLFGIAKRHDPSIAGRKKVVFTDLEHA